MNPYDSLSLWGNRQQDLGITGTNAATTVPQTNMNQSWLSMQNMFGGTDPSTGMQSSGWVSPALGAASALTQSWLGFQNLGLAKDQLNFQKNAWQEQFDMQKEEFQYAQQRRDERRSNYEASKGL